MDRAFFLLLRLAFFGLFLCGLATFALFMFLSRSIPDFEDEIEVSGIENPIEIVRSTHNVPHIFGESDKDVMFALGFAHAQDRLWQMVTARRTVQGRMSEVFGRETLPSDMLMRRLDLYQLSRQSFTALSLETQNILGSYADGVNAWIKHVNENALGRGAPEFFVFSNAIAPWQPADSVALIKLLGVQQTGHLQDEVLRAQLSLALDDNQLFDIFPDVPGTGIAELPDYAKIAPGVVPYSTNGAMRLAANAPIRPQVFAGASNAWAASAKRSATGSSILANDPHGILTAPSQWYLARLELSSGGVIGATIPGVPAIVLGRSAKLGWGLTASYLDDQDLYIEKLEPNAPEKYLTPNGYKAFKTRQSIINIKEEPAITLQLRWTDNGPVLPSNRFDLGSITPPNHVMSVAWSLLSPKDTTLDSMVRMMQAQTIAEALKITDDFIAPSQNLVLADSTQIAMKTIGALPQRSFAHQSKGRLPTPGWLIENRWQGVFPPETNPVFRAIDGGIVGNTNNKVVSESFPKHLSFTWGDTQRVQRWQRLMQNRKVHTRGSFVEAQLDTVSPTARTILPLIGANLWFEASAAEPGSDDARRQEALKLLANWNGEMNEHIPEPLIFSAWMRALQLRLIQDELGPLVAKFQHPQPLFIEKVFRDIEGAARWCDILQSAPVENCEQIARVALEDALNWLKITYGGTVESLRWGDAHQATHDHPMLKDAPLVNWFVNIHQSTSGGDNTLLRGLTSGEASDPFRNVHGATYRGVYDFADPESSLYIISTGQSGHPLSRHYDDLGQLWRRGEYITMSLDPALARGGAEGITMLFPASQ